MFRGTAKFLAFRRTREDGLLRSRAGELTEASETLQSASAISSFKVNLHRRSMSQRKPLVHRHPATANLLVGHWCEVLLQYGGLHPVPLGRHRFCHLCCVGYQQYSLLGQHRSWLRRSLGTAFVDRLRRWLVITQLADVDDKRRHCRVWGRGTASRPSGRLAVEVGVVAEVDWKGDRGQFRPRENLVYGAMSRRSGRFLGSPKPAISFSS